MENVLALLKVHAIVASMNEKQPNFENIREVAPATSEGELEKVTSIEGYQEKKESRYKAAVARYEELKKSVTEAGQYVYMERPANGKEEQAIAKLELERDGCLGEAEKCYQKGDPHGEGILRMLADFKQEQIKMLGLYFDAKNKSPEFAELLKRELALFGEEEGGETEMTDENYEVQAEKVDEAYAKAA